MSDRARTWRWGIRQREVAEALGQFSKISLQERRPYRDASDRDLTVGAELSRPMVIYNSDGILRDHDSDVNVPVWEGTCRWPLDQARAYRSGPLALLNEVRRNAPHDVDQLDHAIGGDAGIPSGTGPSMFDRLGKLDGGSSQFAELRVRRTLKLYLDVTIEPLLGVANRWHGFIVAEVSVRVVDSRAQAFENNDAVIADVAEVLLGAGLAEVSAQFG